jgi:hypothetical protein
MKICQEFTHVIHSKIYFPNCLNINTHIRKYLLLRHKKNYSLFKVADVTEVSVHLLRHNIYRDPTILASFLWFLVEKEKKEKKKNLTLARFARGKNIRFYCHNCTLFAIVPCARPRLPFIIRYRWSQRASDLVNTNVLTITFRWWAGFANNPGTVSSGLGVLFSFCPLGLFRYKFFIPRWVYHQCPVTSGKTQEHLAMCVMWKSSASKSSFAWLELTQFIAVVVLATGGFDLWAEHFMLWVVGESQKLGGIFETSCSWQGSAELSKFKCVFFWRTAVFERNIGVKRVERGFCVQFKICVPMCLRWNSKHVRNFQ